MIRSPDAADTIVVITDANILINLIHINQLSMLGRLPGYEFASPQVVIDEVKAPSHAALLSCALEQGHLKQIGIIDARARDLIQVLIPWMGAGEAVCLALAATRGHPVASDEKRSFRREALRLVGEARILRTEDLIVHAIRCGLFTVAQADAFKQVLADHRYLMPIDSFATLMAA